MTSALDRQLPAEREDAGNVLLDLFEHQVRALLAAGLEVQVRARVGRLLPGSEAPLAAPPAAASPPVRDAGTAQDRALSFAAVMTALGIAERRRLSAAEHDLVSRCKGWIRREMEALRA